MSQECYPSPRATRQDKEVATTGNVDLNGQVEGSSGIPIKFAWMLLKEDRASIQIIGM